MEVFETILLLLFVATVLSTFADKLNVPYPSLLASAGALVAFIPGIHHLEFPPALILALFVAPVLLDAAHDSSLRDLKANWVPLVSLVLVAVTLTTLAVAIVVRLFIPDMNWPAAIALGALLAPPDAVAAITILEKVKPPYRIRKVLEGESLLNDASALIIYKLAVTAVMAGGLSLTEAVPALALVVLGSVVAGCIFSWLVGLLIDRIHEVSTAIVLQFVVTFGVWLLSERLGLSAVVTMVVFAIARSHRVTLKYPALLRVSSFATWGAVTFVLNVLAFIIIGLQIEPILSGLTTSERVHYITVALILLVVVIAVRFLWVMTHNVTARWLFAVSTHHRESADTPPSVRSGIAIGWSGMRGIVTLAAAMALPASFPYRGFMLLTAFVVVLGTLILQGLTLRPLLKALKLPEDNTVEREVGIGRSAALQAAFSSLDCIETQASHQLRAEYSGALSSLQAGHPPQSEEDAQLRLRTVAAARQALHKLRTQESIGDDAFRIVEQELDWLELSTLAPQNLTGIYSPPVMGSD